MNEGGANGGSDGSSAVSAKKLSKRPKYSRFTQQELPAFKPILTPGRAIVSFFLVGIIFIPIGLACLFASEKVIEIVERYDLFCVPSNYMNKQLDYIRSPTTNKTCIMILTVPKKMKGPIFIYYELDNYYQNHRRYVKSRNDKQLRSKDSEGDTDGCSPESFIDQKWPIVPCGLIAWSLFNDTYKFSKNEKNLEVNKKDIAWKSDREHKFGKDVFPRNFQSAGRLQGGAKLDENKSLSEQEDLMVWMRTAALPNFRKIYGKIEMDLEANDTITVMIENNYNTYNFSGKKKLVLSTTTWVGGKNNFLGIAYIVVGGICILLAICFMLLYILKPRALGDPSYLSWNLNPDEH